MGVTRTGNLAYSFRNRTGGTGGGVANTAAHGNYCTGNTDVRRLPTHNLNGTDNIFIEGAGGPAPQVVALGTATETDAAVAIGKIDPIRAVIGTTTETDSPVGLTRRKTLLLGTATETDSLTGLTRRKTRLLVAATETDAAVGIGERKSVGVTAETDAAVGLTRRKTRLLGTATETDSLTGLTRRKTRLLGTAAETDSLTGLTRRKTWLLGTTTETDAAVGVTAVFSGGDIVAVGTATETDTPTGLTRRKTRLLGVAAETDAAVAIGKIDPIRAVVGTTAETDAAVGLTRRKTRVLGATTETDAAVGIGKIDPIRVVIGTTTETDTPTGLTRRKTRVLGVATEADSLTGITRRKTRTVGTTTETDSPTGLTRRKTRLLGAAAETDSLTGLTRRKTRTLGVAAETDTSSGVSRAGFLTFATETDTAVGLAAKKTKALGIAGELDALGDAATEVEHYETGNDGDPIGNTYGIFDGGSDTGSATWLISTARSAFGTRSAQVTVPGGGTTYRRIDLGSNQTLAHYRDYIYIPSVGVAGASVHIVRALRTSLAVAARLTMNSVQSLNMQDGTSGVGTGLDFDDLALFDQWLRIEWKLDAVNDMQYLRVFKGANLNGTIPDHTDSGAFTDASGVGIFEMGVAAATTNSFTYNKDATAWRLADWCGPVVSTNGVGRIKTRALGTATETDTAVGITTGAQVVALGTAPAPATLIADTFTRANGAVGTAETGGAWTVTGTASIVSNQCQLQPSSSMVINTGQSDVDMTVTWVDKGFISNGAIYPRYTSQDDKVVVQHSRIGYTTSPGGGFTEVATFSAIAAGSVVRVLAVGSNIKVYDDGVEVANVTISTHQTATSQGLGHGIAYSSTWDNLTVNGSTVTTDTAVGVTRRKTRSLLFPTETDAPANLTRVKRKAIGFATETDSALSLIAPPTVVALGVATETDTAGVIVSTNIYHDWSFIPPPSGAENRNPRSNKPAGRLFPRYQHSRIHYCVLIYDIDDSPRVIKTIRPTTRQTESADRFYLGPRRYSLTSQEAEILIGAGYDVEDLLNP